jgi:hypothetical protein
MTLNQRFGYVFGAVYMVVGVVGFAVTSGVGFAANPGKNLIIFGLNPLHNIVHILVGALLVLGAAGGAKSSKAINILVGAVYLVIGILGFFILKSSINILAINTPDNFLHLVTAVLALAIGLRRESASVGTATA